MIKIKKATLIVLLILAVLCGFAGFYTLQMTGLAGRVGLGGGHMLSDAQYREYRHLSETFGKADELRDYILNNYYVEVNPEDVDTGMLKGLFEGLGDVYSYYMT
ncbi:MAG: hypothetical protein II474_00990, partial [Firmicutes bacterium]|nr:hypothetical protein [Bacillota bacterium]